MYTHLAGIYPMYHTEKVLERNHLQEPIKLEITTSHNKKINVGDNYQHVRTTNQFKVESILEERPAKGHHPEPVTFYHLILKK